MSRAAPLVPTQTVVLLEKETYEPVFMHLLSKSMIDATAIELCGLTLGYNLAEPLVTGVCAAQRREWLYRICSPPLTKTDLPVARVLSYYFARCQCFVPEESHETRAAREDASRGSAPGNTSANDVAP